MAKKFVWDLIEIEKLAVMGLTQNEIAYNLGSCPATWYNHIKEGDTDILDAYKRGKGSHAKAIIGGLTKAANEGNITAMIFLAKAQHGRRENMVITHEGSHENPVEIRVDYTKLTAEQREARIAELMEKKKKEGRE